MNRRWLITFSLLAHVGLGIGLFVAGVWRIERLDHQHKASLALGVMIPPGAIPEGGASAAAPEKLAKKKKRVVKDAQPQPKVIEAPHAAATQAVGQTGDHTGDGAGKGSSTGDSDGPPGGESCADPLGCGAGTSGGRGDPVCGNSATEPGETCDDGNLTAGDGCSATCKAEVKTLFVPPTVLQGLRISGETQVHAPDTVKTMMLRDGRERSVGTLKLCIATDGGISAVAVAASTKYDAYDARLVAAARGWRYKPYTVNGTPMPVCGMVTFVYTIR